MLRKTYVNLTFQNELAFSFPLILSTMQFRRYSYLLKADEYRRNQAKQLHNLLRNWRKRKNDLQENKDKKLSLLQTTKPHKNQNW